MTQKKKKILIAEDEPLLLEMYKLYFEKAGYEILSAENGQECLKIVKKEKPALILLDILMPVVNGWRVLKEIKGNEETKRIPILVLSNLGQAQEIQKGKELGADDYIIKSNLTPKELLAKVEEIISKTNNQTSESENQ